MKKALAALALVAGAFFAGGCAHSYPRPAGAYVKKGSLWYCYGPQQIVTPGQVVVEDACRLDPCELHMPDPRCLPLGVPAEE